MSEWVSKFGCRVPVPLPVPGIWWLCICIEIIISIPIWQTNIYHHFQYQNKFNSLVLSLSSPCSLFPPNILRRWCFIYHLCKLLEYSNIWYRFSSGIVLFTQSLPVQFHFISRLFFLLICFNFLCIWLSSLVVYTMFFPFHVIISIIIFAHSIWPDILPSYCHIHASRLLGKHQDSRSFSIWKPEKLIKPLFNFFSM